MRLLARVLPMVLVAIIISSVVPEFRAAAPVSAASGCEAVAGNLVLNCGFESPLIGGGSYAYFSAGSSAIPSWRVLTQPNGGVDLTRSDFAGGYPVHQGLQSLDLNHDFQGGVYQDLPTTPGQYYQLTFFLSGYPASKAPCSATDPQTLTVSAGTSTQVISAESYAFRPNEAASPAGNQAFDQETFIFSGATGSTTRLTLTSTVPGCAGPIIDDLVVLPTNQPGATVSGTIYHGQALPANTAGGAVVEVCNTNGAPCVNAPSGSDGHYQVSGLAAGTYDISVLPPPTSLYLRAGRGSVVLAANSALSGQDVVLPDATPPPAGMTISHRYVTASGLPVLYWLDPIQGPSMPRPDRRSPCVSQTSTSAWWSRVPSTILAPPRPGSVTPFNIAPSSATPSSVTPTNIALATGATTSPTGRALGTRATSADLHGYGGSFPPPAPSHGSVDTHVDCTCEAGPPGGGGADVRTPVDPSGTIVNQLGAPVAGATVTLYRADTANGPFVALPSGSDQLAWWSPTNPETTDASGGYAWDVYPGFYRVRASAPGCTAPGNPGQGYVESLVKPVPPAVTGLTLTLSCPVTATPTVNGSSASRLVGQVSYPGRGSAPQANWQQQLEVRFYPPGGATPVLVQTPTTDPQGIFTVDNVPPGPADVRVKQAEALGRRVNGLSFQAGIPVGVDFGALPPGDSDNNNLVDIVDFSLLRAVFGASQTCGTAIPNPLPCADYDGNSLVDIVDFSLLRSTFGQVGPS